MDISVTEQNGIVLLQPSGRIDQKGAPIFQEKLMEFAPRCSAGGVAILVDMSDVAFISSVGLRAFMIATKTTRPKKGRILVAEMNDVVREVFQISRFDKVVECHDTVAAARSTLSA